MYSMKKVVFAVAILISAFQVALAQKIQLTVEFPAQTDLEGMKMYAGAMDKGYEAIRELSVSGNEFSAEIDVSEYGFYNLTGVKGQTQVIVPVFIESKSGAANLMAKLDGKVIMLQDKDDNKALSAFNRNFASMTSEIWKSGRDMTDKELRKLLGNYTKIVKSADPKGKASPTVKSYLDIWAYTAVYNTVSALPRIQGKPASEVSLKNEDILPQPVDVLDSPLASLFPVAIEIVRNRLPKGTIAEQIDYLRSNYETESVRSKVEEGILTRYVAKYDYTTNFEGGLEQLQAMTDKYGLDGKFVEQFKKNRATVKGTPFPADVVLKDKDGNVVDFSSFKGKYVYIDVWASWCGPCVREVPSLQKLESELQNENVVFLSISVDAKSAPWLKKMESLGLHGNQLWDSNAQLCNSLNINGIPFFLIYDAEGKLFMYNAPRPSQGEGLKMMLEGLGK